MIGHFGTAGGYRAFVGYAPAQKLDLAMMINSGQAGDPLPVLMPALKLMVTAAS